MHATDRAAFRDLLADAMAFYRRDVSTFALSVWWQACQSFDFEQVAKALTAHAMDPERGQFAPMPADIVRQLQGTRTDRSLVAWGKALDAMQRVGAYTSVAFDDGVIHAVIEDMGGWVALCRTTMDELPFTQKRFCDTYRAYASRGDVTYPGLLVGECDANNALKGYRTNPPALIGNPERAKAVMQGGSSQPKTLITHVIDAAESGVRRLGCAA